MRLSAGILLISLLLASGSSLAAGGVNCPQLVGRWSGVHESGTNSYSWVAELGAGGSFAADFLEIHSDGTRLESSQVGTWACDGDVFSTDAEDAIGRRVRFKYRILEVRGDFMVYRNFADESLGTVFTSKRSR